MKKYTVNIYSIVILFLWSLLLFSCREDETTSNSSKDALQIYLQANNNKDQAIINAPVSILQGKFVADNSDLFFAVATREVSKNTQLTVIPDSDPALIERYKKQYGKTLPLLPQGSYSLPETINIPAGKSISEKMLTITWKDPSVLKDKNATYLLPVSIKSMDNKDATLTSNRNTIFVEVKFAEVSYSLKTKAGKTSEDIFLKKAGNTVITKDTNPILIASLNTGVNTDVPIKVNIDNSLVSTYNTTNGTQFQILPENTYKLSTTTLNIPKNNISSNELEIQFTDAMSQLDITKQYLLPVKSTSQINLPTTNDVVYLKISISVNNINSNIPATGTIIDRNNWSVQANSEYDIENTASMMLDGDNRTGWLSGSGENATVILDMGQSNMLKGFSIIPTYFYGSYPLFPSSIVVYTSNDGINWARQGIYENDRAAGGNPQNPYTGWITFIEPVNARYVKFDEIESFAGIGELNAIK
ncbi:DUF1735 domain-containing protein [Elizabethkingia anophelis]|nr:DUF1735 domain-containing protein [Elizabethkingia anophelis]MCT3995974.1 DUF1735 domain-containing protein [Elizabethkingia anophelis]MCT3999745.1 DUF1735 domain-containing protein [Elizabethkingia anophelis]MCT4256157.1 DUF1735 domain-containing protein [Elizabethkingia anophelis]